MDIVLSVKKKAKKLMVKDFISITPVGENRGKVLISYILEPFLLKRTQNVPNFHTNQWECRQIAKTFLDLGYQVDIISWDNLKFIPKEKYSYFIDIHSNLERLTPYLNKDCVKILHITGAHWLFQNKAEYGRLQALQQRRKVTLKPRRLAPPSLGIENADFATILGNQFTIDTFRYAEKPIFRIPISATVLYDWPEDKDCEACRKRFLWFGSSGMVHKGLDLVLEVFAEMPEYYLTVCGPVTDEKDFEAAYYKELYKTPNICTIGWVDVNSEEFRNILKTNVGLVYPSCSEGSAGSVVTCMHAGLIPIISYESGVDVNDFGIILRECSIEEIKNSIRRISSLSEEELKLKSRKTWEFARRHHTRETFAEEYLNSIKKILNLGGSGI